MWSMYENNVKPVTCRHLFPIIVPDHVSYLNIRNNTNMTRAFEVYNIDNGIDNN